MCRNERGDLTGPGKLFVSLDTKVFIPAGRVGSIELLVVFDHRYSYATMTHEEAARLTRAVTNIVSCPGGFEVYDPESRYLIPLPALNLDPAELYSAFRHEYYAYE